MSYTYKYPRPAVTADCIVITKEAEPKVLLIQRGDDPFKGAWAFPGGFMDMDETTEQCAIRELEEETGLRLADIHQIGAYSKVDRDPRGRTVTVAYLAVIEEPVAVTGQDDLLSLARMMQQKLSGGHCQTCHIWHLIIMILCRMQSSYTRNFKEIKAMIWFVIITVIVIVFYGIISIGTSRKSVSMESENEEELSIPLSITVTSLSEKNNPSEPLDNDNESSKMKKCMTQKNNVMIRKAERQDVSLLLEFIKGIAKYEKMENEVVVTPDVLEQEMFDEHKAEAVFAVVDGREVGFALYFYNFSTFIGHSGLYLEDLFVWPEDCGKGYGKALLLHLVKIAREHHCGRMEWSCLNWNQPSIDFYLSLGAVPMKEWTVYRLDAAALERLS